MSSQEIETRKASCKFWGKATLPDGTKTTKDRCWVLAESKHNPEIYTDCDLTCEYYQKKEG